MKLINIKTIKKLKNYKSNFNNFIIKRSSKIASNY